MLDAYEVDGVQAALLWLPERREFALVVPREGRNTLVIGMSAEALIEQLMGMHDLTEGKA